MGARFKWSQRLRGVVGRFSLTLRLFLVAGCFIVLSLTSGGFALAYLFREVVTRSFDSYLESASFSLLSNIHLESDGRLALLGDIGDPRFDLPNSGWYWQVESGFGPFLRSVSLWDKRLRFSDLAPAEVRNLRGERIVGDKMVRFFAMRVFFAGLDSAVWITVTGDTELMEQELARFRTTLIVSLTIFAAILFVGLFFQIRFGLGPLRLLSRSVRAVRVGRRERLRAQSFPREINFLVDEMNSLIEHNRSVLTRTRRHVGNLAHALRTPLTVVINALQRQKESALHAELKDAILSMRHHIDYHLARARVGGSVGLVGVSTPIRPVLESITRILTKGYPARRIAVTGDDEGRLFAGDKHDLEEIFGNVIENGCKWAKNVSISRLPLWVIACR